MAQVGQPRRRLLLWIQPALRPAAPRAAALSTDSESCYSDAPDMCRPALEARGRRDQESITRMTQTRLLLPVLALASARGQAQPGLGDLDTLERQQVQICPETCYEKILSVSLLDKEAGQSKVKLRKCTEQAQEQRGPHASRLLLLFSLFLH